jgi:predicted HTH domain antitoxin
MAVELYKMGKLSLGKVAELSGFTKIGFIDILNYMGESNEGNM